MRYDEDYDTPSSHRTPIHRERTLANDPNGNVLLFKVP
jgi:hypothetical protein